VPAAADRPEYLPEQFWDGDAKAVKPEFGAHYSELANFHKTTTEAQAALKARKPEDIKLELKLPDDVKLPDGMEAKIDEKDPRIPMLRQIAVERGLDQDTVNTLVALDAKMKIEAHNAEVARIAAEDQKLGANVKQRKDAVQNWAKGLLDKKEISQDEYDEIRMTGATAAGVTLLEKLIAKSNGTVPGVGDPPPPPKPQAVPVEQRWYPDQQKVS
jgi:hypothetical protein